ncbi:MAG: RHS repeat domain-containing protein [Pseudomonas sp.]|uniref:RHS repeat domain-containing protein n=1 Tax=Pseudomonas sp. TaxID=306 RepID=UPI003D6DDAF9
MVVNNSQGIYSNVFNFSDFISGGVDPRTGIYTCNLTLGEIASGGMNGPSFPINLYFNPLNGSDQGFGAGWSLALTRFDVSTEMLTLSSGERYKATVSATSLAFNELKLETIKASRPSPTRYDIVHKSGLREELQIYGSSEVAVPKRIVAANGTNITLNYSAINDQPMLEDVNDGQRTLLSVSRTPGAVVLTTYPKTSCEAKFVLRLINDRVVSIDLSTGESWKLTYEVFNGHSCLTQVDSPLGAREFIGYQEEGHRFPRSAPLRSIPFVNSHTVFPRHGQPATTKNYEYSDENFLGFNAEGIKWSDEGDNLYQAEGDYFYTSTENLMLEDKVHSSTVRTYNKYHLQVSHETVCKKRVTSQLIEYHLDPHKDFAEQPAQFRLPKIQTLRYENRETRLSRDEVLRTEFDAFGNLLKQVDSSGVTTVSEFYPAAGGEGCPADPLGFVRFEKQRTVFPAAGLAEAATTFTRYHYQLQRGLNGATVQSIVPVREQLFERIQSNETLRSQTDLVYIERTDDPLLHGLLQKQTVTCNGRSTESGFQYTHSGTNRTVHETLTGFDGTRATVTRTYSALNGLKLSEQSEDQGTVVFEYDALGRLMSETVAPDTVFAARRSNRYQLANGSVTPATMHSTDVNGQQRRITYDGLGRMIRLEEQDTDYQADGPLRTVYLAQYNAVGQLVEETRTDWLQGAPLVLKTGFVFDGWGRVKTTLHADGRQERVEFDPVTLRKTAWQEGMGKTVTVYTGFGKPESIEVFDLQDRSLGKTLYEYDGLGRGVSQTDPSGNKTLHQYDVFDRLQRSVLPDGQAVETVYSPHSHDQLPVEVKIAGRSLGQQTFDGLGRLIQSKVGGRVTTAGFEGGFSKAAWEQAPGGERVEYDYERELNGRVTQRKASGLLASYTYHPKLGLPARCTEQGRESRFEYYPSGRLKREISTLGAGQEKTLYIYSLGGRPLTCMDVLGNRHTTTYDEYGRPKSFEHSALKAVFAYNMLGQLETVHAQDAKGARSLMTHLVYDDLGREVSRSFEVDGSGAHTLTSSYTSAGKLAQKSLKSGDEVLRDERFSYDQRGRLSQYNCRGTHRPLDPHGKEIITQTYVFDAMDNLVTLETEFPGGKNLASYNYSASDPTQLVGIRHSHKDYPAPVLLEYDANGQLIKDEQARRLTYDALGRLTQVASALGMVTRGYHYDAQDRLVELSQSVGPATQRYYREGRVINEVCSQDKRTCMRNADIVLGQTLQGRGGGTGLLGTDQQGSVLTQVTGTQRQDFAYSPYGHRPVEGGLFSVLGFSGEQLDPLTGLYLLGNGYRAYSPSLMRFLSPDSMSPFGAGGLNPYAYCAGDPINRVDPTGHFWKALLGIALSIAGVALSVITMAAATPLAVIGLTLAASSATLGVAGIIVDEVAPGSGVGEILGWASLATGVLSAGAGLGALGKSAVQWGNKLANAFKPGLSGGSKEAGRAMASGMSGGSMRAGSSVVKGKGAKAAAKAAKAGQKADDAPRKWTLQEPKPRNIKSDLSQSSMEQYEVFKDSIATEGLSPVEASKRMGDPKYTLLEKKLNRFEVRIGAKDRVTFLVDNTGFSVEILQVGGHT